MQNNHPFRRYPTIPIEGYSRSAVGGRSAIVSQLRLLCQNRKRTVIVAECYPGVDQDELRELFAPLEPAEVIHSDGLALPPAEIDILIHRDLTDDPVFGILTARRLDEFFPAKNLEAARRRIDALKTGIVLVYGVGASLVCRGDILAVADITRWEIQLRYRQGLSNWRTARTDLSKNEKYKRGYFAEWRWADRIKDELLPQMDLYLDMTTKHAPAMVFGRAYRAALEQVSQQPFSMVPYFDPGVWGGDWMKNHFDLPENGSNYAWSFGGVPEENSLLLDFGGQLVQTPALNLVHTCPRPLLGERVHGRFGAEFPIRFDMLDTMNGQNLSLQVHPLTEYIQQHFHMPYTQDESYYLLDTQGDDPCVYLGVKTGTDPQAMVQALKDAQDGIASFPAENFVNRIPVKKHDHVLIPAGTVHCSGADTMVLEISATPYIFTFKLWDWGRLDLDGRPRPIHIRHGAANIQWDRNTEWVKENIVNRITRIYEDERGAVERTGLHEREFLDTFRITTSRELPIRRNGSVHMMNLVEGGRAVLTSESGHFPPFELHYAETCIIPEAAGPYTICSADGDKIIAVIACVRN
jgi:mannose-6-phosphate isomerase class I